MQPPNGGCNILTKLTIEKSFRGRRRGRCKFSRIMDCNGTVGCFFWGDSYAIVQIPKRRVLIHLCTKMSEMWTNYWPGIQQLSLWRIHITLHVAKNAWRMQYVDKYSSAHRWERVVAERATTSSHDNPALDRLGIATVQCGGSWLPARVDYYKSAWNGEQCNWLTSNDLASSAFKLITLQVEMYGECIILTKTDDTKRRQKIERSGRKFRFFSSSSKSVVAERTTMGGISRKAGSVRGWAGYRVAWNGEKSKWLTSNKPIIMSSNASHVAGNAWRMQYLDNKKIRSSFLLSWIKERSCRMSYRYPSSAAC